MKNAQSWRPSKFVLRRGKLRASRNWRHLSPASRLIADLTARNYDQAIRSFAHGDLVDLGAGRVPLFELYSPLVKSVTCVDWPLSEHGEDHLDVQCDISEALPLGTASFDTVILSDVLEHIPEPDKLWAEISRILRPRGRIIMNVPFMYWVHESPHDYYRYTEFALRRFVERNDLRVVSLNPIGHAPAVLADVFGKLLVRIPLIGPTATHLLQEAFLLLLSIGPVDRLFRRTAAAFPSGYFVIAEKP